MTTCPRFYLCDFFELLTKTPRGGHVLFGSAAGDGISEITCWSNGKSHNEVVLLSQEKYIVERGVGYRCVRGIDSLVTLTKEQVIEFMSLLKRIRAENTAIKKAINPLLKYYVPNQNRNRLTFALSGVLHKGGLEEYLIDDLQEYLMDVDGSDTPEERIARFDVIKNTFVKDSNSKEVSGRDKFLEAVNNDESVLVTIQEAFKPLGYFKDYRTNSSSGSSGKAKESNSSESPDEEEQEPNKRHEQVQYYTDSEIFAEAIMIDGKPCFAIADNHGHISLKKEIEVVTDIDDKTEKVKSVRIYQPLQDFSYITIPYSFKSKEDFENIAKFAQNKQLCTLDSLYWLIKSIWSKYIDADNNHLSICAADTIFSYFQDRIGLTHYLFFVGDNDSGKSNNLVVFHFLGYRNMMSMGISVANIYQFLGSGEEGIGTICEDEANSLDEDKDKMDLAKSGYTKGYPVIRISILPDGTRHQRKYNTFCMKLYSAEKAPDFIKAKGLNQRIVKMKCIAGEPEYDILEVVNPLGDDIHEGLLTELHRVRNLLLCYRLVHRNDKMPNIRINLKNREKQLFKPLLRLFQNANTIDELRTVIASYVNERRESKSHGLHAFLIGLVNDMVKDQNYDDIQASLSQEVKLKSASIWAKLQARLEGRFLSEHSLSFDTVEYGIISQKMVISILEDVFKAKVKSSNSERYVIFQRKNLEKVTKSYDIQEVVITSNTAPGSDSNDSTHSTDSGSVSDPTETIDNEECEENKSDNDKTSKKEDE